MLRHYAGPVTYTATGFRQKATDAAPAGLAGLLRASTEPLICDLLGRSAESAVGAVNGGAGRGKKSVTIGVQFKAQLAVLIDQINATQVIDRSSQLPAGIAPNGLQAPRVYRCTTFGASSRMASSRLSLLTLLQWLSSSVARASS